IGSTAPSSHADCVPWAFGTSLLHRPPLAERLCRTADRIDPPGVSGPHHCPGRGASAPHSESYARYYNETGTHLVLDKDAPLSRTVKRAGRILCRPILGGLHHEYVRI